MTDSDIKAFEGKTLFSITVGVASAILQFGEGGSISVYCGFEYTDGRFWLNCRGGWPNSAMNLFDFLNDIVTKSTLDQDYKTVLEFKSGKSLGIISDKTGFEAYVVNSISGDIPVY